MQPHVVALALLGGLSSLLVLMLAASEARRPVRTGVPSEKTPLNWGCLAFLLPYWLVYAVLGHWWPKAQVPFVLLWLACLGAGLVVFLIVRSRQRHRSS